MATRLKTVAFPLPNLSSISTGITTNFTQITVDLPESSKTFKSVWVDFAANDIITVYSAGGINEWRLGAQLNSSGYTTITNTNTITNSGENMSPFISQDFTSLFTTNWTGSTTSMTFNLQVYLSQSGGSPGGFVSGSSILWITYEYEDSTTITFVENAWIPMASNTTAIPTSKGSARDTVPNLDSFLEYTGITYKHIMMIMEGNESLGASAGDFTLIIQLDEITALTGNTHVTTLNSHRYVREHFDLMSGGSPIFTTNATHSFYAWAPPTGSTMYHITYVMLVVFTYGSDSPNGNRSLILPMNFVSPAGGVTDADYQKGSCELWIQEPETIITQKSAFKWYWEQGGPINSPYFRCGTQSFQISTDVASILCGGNCYQRTCDDNIVLTRGRNILTADVYRTDITDKMWGLSGIWYINYKCGRPSGGWPNANHTILYSLSQYGTGAAAGEIDVSATSISIPETLYFINSLGVWINNIGAAIVAFYGYNIVVERLLAEGGVQWKGVYVDSNYTDPEFGHRLVYSRMTDLFKRFPGDADPNKMDIETSRRWRIYSTMIITGWWSFIVMMTYHSISYTISDTISGSGGGTVNLFLHMNNTDTIIPGKLLMTGSTIGDSSYSFTWYDNTQNVYVTAREDSTHLGRSRNALAT
jgi:hypothetical protein